MNICFVKWLQVIPCNALKQNKIYYKDQSYSFVCECVLFFHRGWKAVLCELDFSNEHTGSLKKNDVVNQYFKNGAI